LSRVLELLLADARTPSGGYAHSGGLEAFVDAGGSGCAGSVRGFMSARLRTVGRVEASFAAAACRCASVDELLSLDVELAARSPAAPLRQASRRLGRGLLRTGAAWFPVDGLIAEYRSASVLSPRPVALGVVARAGGVDALGAARASLYDDAATVAAAAVKLLPLDAAEATGWVLALGAEIEALATAAVAPELPSTATPLLDLRAISHATSERRLFAS
jgi:urease accessory protein